MNKTHISCFWSCSVQGDYNKNRDISEKVGNNDGKLFKTSSEIEKTETLYFENSRHNHLNEENQIQDYCEPVELTAVSKTDQVQKIPQNWKGKLLSYDIKQPGNCRGTILEGGVFLKSMFWSFCSFLRKVW